MRNFIITVNGNQYEVSVEEVNGGAPAAPARAAAPAAPKAAPAKPAAPAAPKGPQGAVKISSPMPGTILDIKVSAGDTVSEGQIVCILEAMKMENEIVAPKAGTVASINVTKGASVNTGDVLVTLN